MTTKTIALLVAAGAVLDLLVFAFVVSLSAEQHRINAKTECWAGVLDRAVKTMPRPGHPVAGYRHRLVVASNRCAGLP